MLKAERAVSSVRMLLERDDREGACNRAYYAMFHAAYAALEWAKVIPTGTTYKTNSGLIAAFGKDLVLTRHVEDRFGRALSKVHDIRLLADYTGGLPDLASARWAVDEEDAFVSAIRGKVIDR